ncbi:hypothetical protein SAMN04489764_1832 [Thermostaphylospora chromogena]|uniref:DUF4115 domain-containing protein n=1 Tax=Thermostaphylospora chromogena TaxID=35622 RepID=A0A1H1D5N2_9ACTN|nr:hypothetical protein SAMN04489764_1832 [Thermostaphylospora chromogena]
MLLIGLAILGFLALLVIGGLALFASLDGGSPPAPSATPTPEGAPRTSPAAPPTILIECRQTRCGRVFVRIPGGDVLLDRELARGERAAFDEERLDVVLDDAATVRVEVNGRLRRPEAGREAFTVTREEPTG